MPGTWPGHERLSRMKYQLVMILILPCNGQWVEGISPSFAVVCQYLSHCTGPGAFHFLPTKDEDLEGFRIRMSSTISENNYLA